MKPKVYIETSIVSYLTSNPSRDPIVAGHQAATRKWWDRYRADCDCYTSPIVVREAGRGDPELARLRLEVIEPLDVLPLSEDAEALAGHLVLVGTLPAKAADDAFHVAISAIHRVGYLLTWNCKHLANARSRPRIEKACRGLGFEPPIICTPDELMGDQDVA